MVFRGFTNATLQKERGNLAPLPFCNAIYMFFNPEYQLTIRN
jgi:hypothetical protein